METAAAAGGWKLRLRQAAFGGYMKEVAACVTDCFQWSGRAFVRHRQTPGKAAIELDAGRLAVGHRRTDAEELFDHVVLFERIERAHIVDHLADPIGLV